MVEQPTEQLAAVVAALLFDARDITEVGATLAANVAQLGENDGCDAVAARALAGDVLRDAIGIFTRIGGTVDDLVASADRILDGTPGARPAIDPTPPRGIRVNGATGPDGDAPTRPAIPEFPPRPATDHVHYRPNNYTSCSCGVRPPGDGSTHGVSGEWTEP
jgi:hypothetical protein